MEEEVFTISITVSQPAAKIDGTVEIVDDYGLSIVASQQGVELEGVAMSEISQTALIAFGQWYKGDPGRDGDDGRDGTDGFSPVVTVTPTEDGHEVTITDADGDHTFDVNDGVGVPQTLSLAGNELTLSDGGGTVTLPDGLPSQTGNAGKVLTTDGTDASWEEMQDTSFVCNFTITSIGETEQRITCDKSIAEIIAAAQSGKEVRGFAGDGSGGDIVTMSAFEDHYVVFQSIIVVFGTHLVYFSGDDSTGTDVWSGGVFTYSNVAFSGDYQDLRNKPTLGTASALDVAESGNASTTQVVKGDDTRLSDSRNAADVYPWAKQPTKPSYTASEVGAIAYSEKGSNNGVAELDATGKVPSSQLPSYVDDALEYASQSAFPATGESGKIYIALDTNKTYRWGGSSYTEISESLALGTTSTTAYRGDLGAANASAITAIKDGTTIDSFGDVETALQAVQGTIPDVPAGMVLRIYRSVEGTAGKTSSPYKSTKWDVTDSTISEYVDGMVVNFKVPVAGVSTYGGVFQINNLGYKPVVYGANTTVAGRYPVGGIIWMQYNATQTASWYDNSASATSVTGCWQVMDYDTNTTAIYTLMYYRGTRICSADLYRYVMCVFPDDTHILPLNSTVGTGNTGSTSTSKVMTTGSFDPMRGIVYYSTNAAVTSGSTVAMSTLYRQTSSVDLRYTFNCDSSSFTANSEVYMVMDLQSDGLMCKLASTPFSNTLPSTNDGHLYMLLGYSYSKYQIELYPIHTIYYHDGTNLKVWTGATAVSGTNDGTNWTSITIGSVTKNIPSGGGGGLSDHDFTHTANTTVSTSSTTITFAANTRGSQMITVSDDISISFVVNNDSDNYLWIENSDTTNNIDVTISSVTHNGNVVSNVRMPRDGIAVPAGGTCEIGIVCNTDGAFITSRDDLE